MTVMPVIVVAVMVVVDEDGGGQGVESGVWGAIDDGSIKAEGTTCDEAKFLNQGIEGRAGLSGDNAMFAGDESHQRGQVQVAQPVDLAKQKLLLLIPVIRHKGVSVSRSL